MEQFFALLTLGLGLGAVYALAAVGLALIFRLTSILHFAHGSAMVVAAYTLLGLEQWLSWPFAAAVCVAVVAAAAFGPVVYRLTYAPLERRGVGELGFVITSFGLLIVVQNAVALIFGTTPTPVPAPGWLTTGTINVAGVHVRLADLLGLIVALLAIGVLAWFLRATRAGLVLRALEGNPRLASDLGIVYARSAPLVFLVGSALAGLAAVISASTVPISPDDGFEWTLVAYVGMAIGGTRSVWSAAVGGFVLGVLGTVPDLWVSQNWNRTLTFAVLLLVLIFLPRGLVPARDVEGSGLRDTVTRLLGRQPKTQEAG